MTIGLYFGSFNPIHLGHLIVANSALNYCDIKRVWFVVTPKNPLKDSKVLLKDSDRLRLARLAIEDNSNFRICDIEFKLPKPSYTINTLTHLEELFPENEFKIIMGSDSYNNLSKWKNYQAILKRYPIIVYERKDFNKPPFNENPRCLWLDIPIIDISSSQIRLLIKQKKSIRYLVPDKVFEEINNYKYYQEKY